MINWTLVKSQVAASEESLNREFSFDEKRVRRIYEARANRIAQRSSGGAALEKTVAVFAFTVAGERYGVDLSQVAGVTSAKLLESLPGIPIEALGILPIQGEMYVVLSLRALLGLPSGGGPPGESALRAGYVLQLRKEGLRVGLWIETSGGLDQVLSSDLKAAGEGRMFLRPLASDSLTYIEIQSLFEHPIFQE